MNVRRSFAALAGVALLATLTACGGDDDANTTAAQAPAAEADAAADGAADTSGASTMSDTPGTGADAYDPDDPFVGTREVEAPPKTIVMASFNFTPKKITVKPGETWAIDNQDIALHDVRTQDNKTISSGDVQAGQKGSVKFPTKPGKYETVCFYHQSMVLDVTVKK